MNSENPEENEIEKPKNHTEQINNEIEQFIKVGGSVFNKHIMDAGENILLDSEAIIINENKKLIGVGKALTSHDIMKRSKIGAAIKVRHI
jgi:predicted RNA-binding protein (TIGR00451 family)